MKKLLFGIAAILAIIQTAFIVLQIIQVLDLPILWLFAPLLTGLLLGAIFIIWYVLRLEKKE